MGIRPSHASSGFPDRHPRILSDATPPMNNSGVSQATELRELLETPDGMERWLTAAGIPGQGRGVTNLRSLAATRLPVGLLAGMLQQLQEELRRSSDPDMALNYFERFFLAARNRLGLAALMERDPTVVPVLVRIFSTSHYLGELLIRDQEAFDALRMSEGQPQLPETLEADINAVLGGVADPAIAMRTLRRFKQREILRIAYGDLVVQHRLGMVTEQISWLAQALCQGALGFCFRQLCRKWGRPRDPEGNETSCVILAMGKLGGRELNYSSDIDLVMVYGEAGECDGPRGRSNQDFFEELTRDFTRLMSETTADGFAWRVDWRLRPEGQKGRLCLPGAALLRYYEQKGRAWERQALIKARPVAGDLALGAALLRQLEPWIWRRLSHFDITAVKSLKRQIERRAIVGGVDHRDVKTGRGGIRDIEFTTQFLQLLHGRKLPEIRHFNTLQALERLQRAGCLTLEEETLLMQNYIWLRKLEHRLQILSDLQTHRLPDDPAGLRQVALRMGYREAFGVDARVQFQADYEEITSVNRRILDHQLHGAFADQPDGEVPEVVDLLYVSEVAADQANRALEEFAFTDRVDAARRIQALGTEASPFLSHSRCRHFLAAVLPRLLREIHNTPDPDRTLAALHGVAEQLGAKGVLWEVFNVQPEAMRLFVRMCSEAGYLTAILRSNPGMIDELIDALQVGQLPTREWLERSLADLSRGATDPTLIIHSFKQAQHLRTGVVDLTRTNPIRAVNRALSDIADVCLGTIAQHCYQQVLASRGEPTVSDDQGGMRTCACAIVACGKQGGAELNYQSDLDLFFLFEADGPTRHADPARNTSNQHFFSDWASAVTRFVTARTQSGRLYDIDSRLRPTGKSGSLATSAVEMGRYFQTGQGQPWERLALCKARVVWATGDGEFARQTVRQAILCHPWSVELVEEIALMRQRMEQSVAGTDHLKRGPGGTVDIEFAVQLLQMREMERWPQLQNPSAFGALATIRELGLLPIEILDPLEQGFLMLRSVESCLRLADETPHHSLQSHPTLPDRIARMMRMNSGAELSERVREVRANVRAAYLALLDLLRQPLQS